MADDSQGEAGQVLAGNRRQRHPQDQDQQDQGAEFGTGRWSQQAAPNPQVSYEDDFKIEGSLVSFFLSSRFGEMALANCCDSDRLLVEEEMGLLQQEFEQYKRELADAKTSLEVGLVKWTEYDDQFKLCSKWLADTEVLVQSFMKLQPNICGKKTNLEQFQHNLQSIFDWQKALDRLNIKAQMLLDTCADSRISNAVTQLTTKYNALLSLSKEVMRRLEQHYQEHHMQQSLLSELRNWLEATNEKLTSCDKPDKSIAEIKARIETTKTLKNNLEHEQNKLRYLLELKEKVILNTDPEGATSINEDMDNLQADFDKLLNAIASVRATLTNKLTDVEELSKRLLGFDQWLHELESILNKDLGKVPADFVDKLSNVEKFRGIQRDIVAHKELAENLRSKSEADKSGDIIEIVGRYETIKKLVEDEISTLEQHVKVQEEYKDVEKQMTDWLTKTKNATKRHADLTIDLIKLQRNLRTLEDLEEEEFPFGEKLLKNVNDLGTKVKENSGQMGQSIVENSLEHIDNDWKFVKSFLAETNNQIETCISIWSDYDQINSKVVDWLSDFETRVKSALGDDRGMMADLEQFKKMLEELESHEDDFDELNTKSSLLFDTTRHSQIQDQTVNILTNRSSLQSKLNVNYSLIYFSTVDFIIF